MRLGRVMLLVLLVLAEATALVAIVSLLRSTVTTGIWSPVQRVSEERFLPLAPNVRVINIANDMGQVVVREVSSGFGVQAKVKAAGRTQAEAAERLKLVEVSVTEQGDSATVVANAPSQITNNPPHADLTVLVPRGTTVVVQASMGQVSVFDLHGTADINAKMGRVEVEDFSGSLSVVANMGQVDVINAAIDEKLNLQAKMGSVHFSGRLGRDNRIEADMGSIELDLASDQPALDLDAEWKMGRYENKVPFAGTVQERSARGVIGAGTPSGRLEVRAAMGSIRVY